MLHCAGAEVQPVPLVQAAAPGQLAPPAQLFCPLHVTSHAHAALHPIVPPHALEPAHVTSHGPLPHWIAPPHVLDEPHRIEHDVAPMQLIWPPHADGALQMTSHAIPAGHWIDPGQLPVVVHANWQVVALLHRPPATVHASGHGAPSGSTAPMTQ